MAKKFDLDDEVVVIIGSGAGGGTLGNELAQKGINVVILEAGKRHEINDFENDEWPMFSKISWLDKRTTSGTWRVSQDFPNLPAWIVKAVGGSTVHWAGASLRFQEHEFKARTTYGKVAGANLLDWPITLAELTPYYDKAEKKWVQLGRTASLGYPAITTTKYWQRVRKRWAMSTFIPGICLSIPNHVMVVALASKLASAFKVVNRELNGLLCTPRFLRVSAPVTLKYAQMHKLLRLNTMHRAK